jgi:RNA polymerase sigma-70 factor (ECF subfamily)
MLAEPKTISQDEEVILSIKQGNKDKNKLVQKLIDDHHGFIHKLKLETGLSEIELKDIYTDTVLLVLQHIENNTFKGESKLSTYFFRIFYFKTVDYLRKVSANKIDYTGDLPDQNDAAQNVTSQIEVRDEMSQIVRLLDKMCAPCRQIIMDWAYWGYKPDEIGERIGERDPVKFSKMKYNCVEKFKKLWNKRMRLL